MTDINERLDAAYNKYREAQHEVTQLSVHALCKAVRAEYPDCKTLTFDWSDQGSWLELRQVDDNDDDDGDLYDLAGDLASNLDDATEHIWMHEYMTKHPRVVSWLVMDVDQALAKSAVHIYGTPTTPDEIEEFLNS